LESLHGGLGQRAEEPVDRPRALARPAQPSLQDPHPLGAVGLAVARPGGEHGCRPAHRGRGQRPDEPVNGELLLALEAAHGGLGQRAEEPVDRPRALAGLAQAPLERAHAVGAVGLAVARPGGDQRRLGPATRLVGLGLGDHRPGAQQHCRD
jgi:hypothetical protein